MITPTWQETLVALHRATTPQDLWLVLLAHHGIRSSSAWDEPYSLFTNFHADDPADSVTTALLLCTDYRWRKASHRLIHKLDESGLLDDRALGLLSTWFISAQVTVSVHHAFGNPAAAPTGSVTAGLFITVDPLPPAIAPSRGTERLGDELLAVRRSVWPPLRRWASARHVRSTLGRWRDLVELAAQMPNQEAAMILSGAMDAAAHIPEGERSAAIEIGLESRSGIVRLAALSALAALEGVDVAKIRAIGDPSERVRAWGLKAAASPAEKVRETATAVAHSASFDVQPTPPRRSDQPTLF